jgi:hypothetical protein
MHAPYDDLAKKLAAHLSHVGADGVRRVRLDDIAKALGLEFKKVVTRARALKIPTAGEPSSELNLERTEDLILELIRTNPQIDQTGLAAKFLPVSEPLKSKPALGPKAIIAKFIIIDGSNVFHWMKDNKQDDKVNLIPLLIILTALKREGFDFCCYVDANQEREMENKRPDHFKAYEKLRKTTYPMGFSGTPGGASADAFILLDAKNSGRKVLSNDRFRDHPIQLPRSQLIKGTVANCQIVIPDLGIVEPLILDLRKAVRDLEAVLKSEQ